MLLCLVLVLRHVCRLHAKLRHGSAVPSAAQVLLV